MTLPISVNKCSRHVPKLHTLLSIYQHLSLCVSWIKKKTSKISAKQNYIISHHFTVSHFALTITTAYPWRLNTRATWHNLPYSVNYSKMFYIPLFSDLFADFLDFFHSHRFISFIFQLFHFLPLEVIPCSACK